MYRLSTVLLLVTAISCGSQDNNDSSDSDSESSTEKAARTRTLALETKDDLPDCTSDNDDQLIYVIDEDQFYTCKKKEWEEIDIAGKDAEQLDDNHFLDKVTGYLWQVGTVVSDWAFANACTGDWEFPNKEDAKTAVLHGLDESGDGVWTSEAVSATHAYYVSPAGLYSSVLKSEDHRAVCVRK